GHSFALGLCLGLCFYQGVRFKWGLLHDFKPEIDTKEAIRETVGEVDTKVINQLERWWDKYRLSLTELDAQAAEAENVMKGYLKELGYE
ncbi:hypothetical protein ACE05B_20835, partial [Marinobacter shengliensis]